MTDKVAAPVGLASRGRRFWRSTITDYDLTAAELELLLEVCRTLDALDRLADSIATLGAMVPGSAGQMVINPAMTEARGQRGILHRLVSAMALPDPEGAAVPTVQSTRARKAAVARWQAPKMQRRRDAG